MKYESRQNGEVKWKDILNNLEKDASDICRDFEVFCGYIAENQVNLTKQARNIGKKDCHALNALFHVREEYEKPAYVQEKYPIISFFYYTAIKYKILETNSSGTILQQGRNYQYYCEASVWERYALFLTIFLFDGTFAKKESYWYPDSVMGLWPFYIDSFMEGVASQKLRTGLRYRWSMEIKVPYYYCMDFIASYLEELNLIKIWKKPASKDDIREYSWEIEPLPLLETVSELYENMEEYQKGDLDDMIQWAYKAYVSGITHGEEAGNLLDIFTNTARYDEKQTIDLEVSVRYTKCIRVIRMNLTDSLCDLHEMIQKAVSFDDDHLFEFTVGYGMMKRRYLMPEAMNSERDLSVETSLGELDLREGQIFTYLFDYGDRWEFDIKVLAIQEGSVKNPEVIRAMGDAPEQYPNYVENEEWQIKISGRIQAGSILSQIEDELIIDEYAALAGSKNTSPKEPADTLRREMERLLLKNPDRMLMFITPEMRKMLSEFLRREWISGGDRCTLAQLYSFGFCDFPDKYPYVVSVPESVKEIYAPKIKSGGKYDKIVETAEVFLRRCGVVEMEVLYTSVTDYLKRKLSYEDFTFLIYSRLHYFGSYYSDSFCETEYMSCYEREMTQRILEERQKPENTVYTYPALGQIYSGKRKEMQKALGDWAEYVGFNLNIDWQTAESLIEQIPAMAAAGIMKKEEIVAAYREMLRGTKRRVTKKAEELIDKLCSGMPTAVKKGNTCLEDHAMEEKGTEQTQGQISGIKGKKKSKADGEYSQISIFD